MKHTLSCLVYNRPGVLAKIASTFAVEGINIYSLAAGEVEEEEKSRMTIVVEADEDTVKRAEEHLVKINEVIKLFDLLEQELIAMELLLIKIRIRPKNIPQILQIAEIFNAQVIAVSEEAMVLTLASEEKRVDGLVKMLKPFKIVEMSRSGKLAVRGVEQEVS
ncbi:MAG: acetolactate synthase small subunit [Spirochaetota bacterium]|nr:MAG: acetolactate synthase small subunit [Spirochaetota bacterium]